MMIAMMAIGREQDQQIRVPPSSGGPVSSAARARSRALRGFLSDVLACWPWTRRRSLGGAAHAGQPACRRERRSGTAGSGSTGRLPQRRRGPGRSGRPGARAATRCSHIVRDPVHDLTIGRGRSRRPIPVGRRPGPGSSAGSGSRPGTGGRTGRLRPERGSNSPGDQSLHVVGLVGMERVEHGRALVVQLAVAQLEPTVLHVALLSVGQHLAQRDLYVVVASRSTRSRGRRCRSRPSRGPAAAAS